jgi:uncharacterized membrane protein
MKAKEIRASAREALQGNWGVACIAGIIASLFGAVGGYPSFEFDMESEVPPIDLNNPVVNWEVLTPIIIGAVVGFAVGLVIALVLGSFVSIGYAQFNLDMVDVVKPRIRTLFSKWSQVGTAIKAYLLVFLHVFIGSCLFVIPGLIAAYKYSMVAHVIAENPGITAREALRRSKEIMKGNKWRLFCLHLSFIGWNLLVLITLGIAAIWVVPYEQAAVAAFYREIA